MSKYDNYYYYELTDDDKKIVEIHSRNKLQLTYVFIENGLVFNDIFHIYLEKDDAILFYGNEEKKYGYIQLCEMDRLIMGNLNEFSNNYGNLYELGLFGSDYNFILIANNKYINENDNFVLYSKIPAFRDKYIETIFYIKCLYENNLPEDVVKYTILKL